jgi:dipeptidyl aminopeptidase/acylaminoacyl peptidase
VKRTHVFVVSNKGGSARDVTAGDFDSPPYAAASGVDFAFSPDSTEIAYLRNPDKVEALSTNSDIYVAPLSGGQPKNITASNRGYDASPVFTKDGRFIVYRSQATPAFEADRWRLMAYNRATGTSTEIAKGFDEQVEEIALAPDGNSVYFTAGQRGKAPIFRVALTGGTPQKVIADVFATNLRLTPDGKRFIFAGSSLSSPAEIYVANIDGTNMRALTAANVQLMTQAKLTKAEEMEWNGALGRKIHGYVVKPNDFRPRKEVSTCGFDTWWTSERLE